jgi:AraC family transcriptional regulator
MEIQPPRVRFHGKALAESEIAKLRLAERQVAGFYVAETAYPPGFKTPKHSHVNGSLYLVLQGTCTETHGGKSWECKPLSIVFTPPGAAHTERFYDAGGRCLILEITPGRIERAGEYSIRLDAESAFYGGPLAWLCLRLHKEFRNMDEASPLAIEGLALEIMAAVSRQRVNGSGRRPPRWLLQTRELLHARFSENLALNDLAQAVGVHPVYLATVFRRHYRRTVGEYVRHLRIEFACQRITRSDVTLVEIALAAGFADQSHFSKTFKQVTGMSPARFRARFRQT